MNRPFPLASYDGRIDVGDTEEIWIRGRDLPTNVARKLVTALRTGTPVSLAAIGSDAVNSAVKSVAIARQMWADLHMSSDVYMTPQFSTVIDPRGNDRTRMVLRVFVQNHADVVRSVRL